MDADQLAAGPEMDRRVAEALMPELGDLGMWSGPPYSTAPGPQFDEMLKWLAARPGCVQVELFVVNIHDDGETSCQAGLRCYLDRGSFPSSFADGATIYEAVARLVVAVHEAEKEASDA